MSLKDGRNKMNEEIRKEIELINKIITEATFYGGDSGGPYCCNPEDLVKYLIEYIAFREWSDFCIVKEEHGYIIIAEKE